MAACPLGTVRSVALLTLSHPWSTLRAGRRLIAGCERADYQFRFVRMPEERPPKPVNGFRFSDQYLPLRLPRDSAGQSGFRHGQIGAIHSLPGYFYLCPGQ